MKSYKKDKVKYLWTIQMRKSIPSLLGLMIFAIFLIGILTLHNPKTLPFHQIKIIATGTHPKISELKNIVIQHINGGFFSFSARELRSALMALPWVYNVSIRRIWPNELEIFLVEQQPLARWNRTQLISKLGTFFNPSVTIISKDLPQLEGPDNYKKIILAQFKQFNQLLEPLRIKITALKVNDRETWFLVLNDHIRVYLGREDIDRRFKKLVLFYQKIISDRNRQVDYIDLRYPNGLAIRWKGKS